MTQNNIHPSIKSALKNDLKRTAPIGMQANIMNRVLKIHAATFNVPRNNGLAFTGLLVCAVLFALPTLLPEQAINVSQNWQLPDFNIPTWLWFSVCAGVSLFAADSIINQKMRAQKMPRRGRG